MSEPESDQRPTPQNRLSISRQRLVEFTVVVLGVLVALGLENLVQEARYRGDARDLEKAFVDDIQNAVFLSLERQAVTPCLTERLRTLSERVDVATGEFAPAEDIRSSAITGYATSQVYRAPLRNWVTSSFDRALSSEAFKRIPGERAAQYARLFAQIRTLQERNQSEFLVAPGLAPLAYSQPNMNAEVRADALQQIALLDSHQLLMAFAGGQIVEGAFALPTIGKDVRRSLAEGAEDFPQYRLRMSARYGDCFDFTVMERLITPAAS